MMVANGGFGFDMWATVVNRDGIVCAVAFTRRIAWRSVGRAAVISAQKANTATPSACSLRLIDGEYLFRVQSLVGACSDWQESNPVDPDVAYRGQPSAYDSQMIRMVGAGSVA